MSPEDPAAPHGEAVKPGALAFHSEQGRIILQKNGLDWKGALRSSHPNPSAVSWLPGALSNLALNIFRSGAPTAVGSASPP